MMKVDVHREVFNKIYIPYLDDNTPLQIYYGGAGSGKSKFVAQRVVWDLLPGGRNYLVCREVGKSIRGSVAMEIQKVIREWNVQDLFAINKTDGTITCENGYQCVFTGLDDVEKLKSITPAKGVFTDAWIEEATETSEMSVAQIQLRQRGQSGDKVKRITMTFNPILQTHWIYDKYFRDIPFDGRAYRSDEVSILKTTYKDNRFLTDQDRGRLENEKDPYRYDVYTLGNWGVLGNVIFTNWRAEDLSGMVDQFTNHRNGGDFGYSDDPAAIVCSHYDRMRKKIYVYDELYQTGLTNDVLSQETVKMVEKQVITWDNAEPKSIAELRRNGVSAKPSKKGKDSVLHGIQWLQQQEIIIDNRCINLRNELQGYKWKEDKGGNALPVPIDTDNHLIDALRYAYEDDMNMTWFMSEGED